MNDKPPPLPRLPDQRQRYALYQRIDTARRKAVDMDLVYLLDEFTRFLQAVSMTMKGTVPDTRLNDVPDVPKKTVPENVPDVPNVPKNNSQDTPVPEKATPSRGRPPSQSPKSDAERKAEWRAKKKAELDQLLKGPERKK